MRGVSKRFGATVALQAVDFGVRSGEVHALVGENGAGKSTLMKVLSGAEEADAGEMLFDGKPFRPTDPLDARRRGVAMIYQELALAEDLTIEQNICLGVEPTRFGVVRGGEAVRRTRDALAVLGHGDMDPGARVRLLPIAERQIVEIARAVATGCRALVLDEPTSSLAQKDVARLFGLVARLKAQGCAVVYISHFLEEARQVADRFTVLRDGRTAGGGRTESADVEDIVALMIGRRIDQLYPRSKRTAGPPMLAVEDLAGLKKPEFAALELRQGEVFGIAGLVGAGRTELLRAVFGLDKVRRGTVRVGLYAGPGSPARRLSQGVGLLSEDRKGEGLAATMTVADNLTMSRMNRMGPLGIVWPSRQAAATRRWIARLGIRCREPNQLVGHLSGGNQQKVALARLLLHDVDVLLMDEPTRGIDVASKAQIYRIVDDLATGGPAAGRAPKAVLMVSSYLPELLGVCDRVAVMCRGVLGPARPVEEWDERALLTAATGRAGP